MLAFKAVLDCFYANLADFLADYPVLCSCKVERGTVLFRLLDGWRKDGQYLL